LAVLDSNRCNCVDRGGREGAGTKQWILLSFDWNENGEQLIGGLLLPFSFVVSEQRSKRKLAVHCCGRLLYFLEHLWRNGSEQGAERKRGRVAETNLPEKARLSALGAGNSRSQLVVLDDLKSRLLDSSFEGASAKRRKSQ